MSFRSILNKDSKEYSPIKSTTLNPHAAEFVPSSLRSFADLAKSVNASSPDAPRTSGKAILNRSESNASNNSDDEAHRFWCHQLPDDITPDFKGLGENELHTDSSISLSGLSIHDGNESSCFVTRGGNQSLGKQRALSILSGSNINLTENLRYSTLRYTGDESPVSFRSMASNPWKKQLGNNAQHISNGREGFSFNGDTSAGFLNDLISDHAGLDNSSSPLEFLALQFPGFDAESLEDVYYANRCDLNMAIDFLARLEIQADGNFNQKLSSKTLSAPNLAEMDFPQLAVPDVQNGFSKYAGKDFQRVSNTYQLVNKESYPLQKSSPLGASRVAPDSISAAQKLGSQDSGSWKYKGNGSADLNVGSSRSSQFLANSYDGNGKSVYMDKLPITGAVLAAPLWLETGDAVGNLYADLRGEAGDHAHLRDSHFEQAGQTCSIGKKVFAKDVGEKGQLYELQVKAAEEKAKENTYGRRNPVARDILPYNHGQDPLIDLHGLHISEAVLVLRHELSVLRRTARSAGQRLQVMIYVGTGYPTKGSRSPVRLPVAIEQYLLEDGLQFTEPQPGLLRVVIY